MNNQPDQLRDPGKDAYETIQQSIGLMQALAMPPFAWWTKFGTAGEMFFRGRMMFIGWLILPLWPMCLMPCDPRPVYVFFGLTTLLLPCHWIRHAMLRRRGYRPHSQGMGLSRLSWPGRYRLIGALEASLTTLIGIILGGPWPALGWYLVWAGIAMLVSLGYAGQVQRSMLRRINDAKKDQEWLAERMREQE